MAAKEKEAKEKEPPPEFHGIGIPEGVERRTLYHSSYRTITTYAMPLADLDSQFKVSISDKKAVVKEDTRTNFSGRMEIITCDNAKLHVLMDTCGNSAYCQLKMWTDF